MKTMKKRVVVGLLTAALAVPFLAGQALALEAKLSGQVNQMVMSADDGKDSDFFVTDNDASSTRFRFTGEEDLGGIKAGFQMEFEYQQNPSNTLTINTTTGSNGGYVWEARWLNAYFVTQFGKVEIGKGDTAANTTAEVDLSGTSVVTYSDINTSAGGFQWRLDDGSYIDTNTATAGVQALTIGNTRTNFDGPLSRAERLRYNTPAFAGFTAAASAANGGAWDAGVYYAADIYGKLAAAVGYTNPQRQGNYTQWAGSISWLAPFGFNLTGAYGQRDVKTGDDSSGYYIKAGYQTGIHAISIEYGLTSDYYAKGYDSSNYGIAYVIKPWKPTEFYAAYRIYMLDAPAVAVVNPTGADPKDISVAMVGTRIKF